MHAYLLSHVPRASRAWVETLLGGADEPSLGRFVQWHGGDSLGTLFARLPPWEPPDWNCFIRHGIPDWPPVVQRITAYLPPDSFNRLRILSWDLAAGVASPEEAAYRIFWWVSGNIAWSAVWGTATPIEIIARGRGSSLHIAQVVTALCRALFIPARLVEEVALIPPVWQRQAQQVWRETPTALRRWLGTRVFFHPLCEVRVGNRWQPLDAQRAQFGWAEVQQHLRVPRLLKLSVHTWEDYGRSIARTGTYTIRPLIGAERDESALTFKGNLRAVGSLLAGQRENAGIALDGADALLDQVQIQAQRLWERRPPRRAFSLVSGKPLSEAAALNLQAVIPAPLAPETSSCAVEPPAQTTLLLVGASVTRILAASYRERLEAGTHILALYESWGDGEHAIRRLLTTFGGDLGGWSARPGDGPSLWQVRGTGRLASLTPWPCTLDLRLVRLLRPPVGSDGSIAIAEEVDRGSPGLVGATLRVGQGRLTFIPINVASLADPYSVLPLSGCHRRLLGALARL